MPTRPNPPALRALASPYALLTYAALLWAINWVLARGMREASGPFAMAFGRWLVAMLVIWPFAWRHLARDWPQIRARRGVLVLLGLTGAGGYNALSYVGVAHTTALNAMLLNAIVPFFIMALAWLLLRESLRATQVAGLCVSLAGACWIIAAGDPARLLALSFNPGDLIVVTAMLSWAVYTVIIRKYPLAIHVTSFVAVLSVIAVLSLLPFALWEAASRPPILSAAVLAGYVYLGLGPSLLCYLFWNAGVAALGAHRTGMFLYLVPVFGSVLSALVLGENPEMFHAVGFMLVLIGLGLSNLQRR